MEEPRTGDDVKIHEEILENGKKEGKNWRRKKKEQDELLRDKIQLSFTQL